MEIHTLHVHIETLMYSYTPLKEYTNTYEYTPYSHYESPHTGTCLPFNILVNIYKV